MAGDVQRQIDQTLQPPVQDFPPPPANPVAAPSENGPKVVIKRFAVEGSSLIPAAELAHQLDAYRDQPLSLPQLQASAQELVGYYRERGWFVRVELPQQDVTDGTLRIVVVEGRLGNVVREPGQTRANGDFVQSVVSHRLEAGQPYSLAQLERGLLLANDLPGVSANGVLQPGTKPGTSDLKLAVADQPLLAGQLSANTFGNRYTGRVQGGGSVAVRDLTGYGDQLSVQGMFSDHLDYEAVNYSFALNTDGLRANLGYSQLHYHLAKQFSDLDVRGEGQTMTVGLSYPLMRSSAKSLWLAVDYNHSRYQDSSFGESLHDRQVDNVTVSAYGNRINSVAGTALDWRVGMSQGHVGLDLDDDRDQDATGPRVAGTFTRLNLDATRSQRLTSLWYTNLRVAGQWAPDNLDGSQQFSLGGPSGVRGYSVNEGQGDSGILAQAELHRLLAEAWVTGLDGYVFLDGGVVRQHHDTYAGWDTADTGRNTYGLAAAGVGVNWTLPGGFMATALLAAPIGSNPAASDDKDQDGGHHGPRAWLGVTQKF